ncbi:MAG: hypothetical protein KF723_11885 [Rhizobiaceae bacterium]|nr:hypothetical protein [Rhizobiaceae bacterium]
MAEPLFETGNPGRLGVPPAGMILMIVVFGFPAVMLPATTWSLVPEFPIMLPAFYLLALFPLAVLFVLRRLMSRYALRLLNDGTVELVLPFKTIRLSAATLSRVVFSRAGTANRGQQTFASFIDARGTVAASVAASAFSSGQWQGFLDALRTLAPHIAVEGPG